MSLTDYQQLMKTHPERIVTGSVKGMLPKNRLGRKLMSHLKVYAGEDHPHAAQNPKPLDI
jgi:large subunit ribosomal protein L13